MTAGKEVAEIPIEVKSTTRDSVSTARDVGLDHIQKWRTRVWIFGFYNPSGTQRVKLLCLKPSQMREWIDKIESYILPDFAIGKQASQSLTLEDLFVICGEKDLYTIQDARKLHKRQWNAKQYELAKDLEEGYSQFRMLEILKMRAVYLNERGSTLNNPHIPNTFFEKYNQQILVVGAADPAEIRASVERAILDGWAEIQNEAL